MIVQNIKKQNLRAKYFFFNNFALAFEYLTKSIYFNSHKNGKGRTDFLFGLNRSYHRTKKQYVYSFHMGRVNIRWFKKI